MKAIDTNVVVRGASGTELRDAATVPGVIEEVKSKGFSRQAKRLSLTVMEPGESEEVREVSEAINSPTSETDENLVTLGKERDITVVSDDKAVQNLCHILGISYEGFMDEEIEEPVEWFFTCKNCGNSTEDAERCRRCGSGQVTRKVREYSSG